MLAYSDRAVRSQPCAHHGATLPTGEFVPPKRSALVRFQYARLASNV